MVKVVTLTNMILSNFKGITKFNLLLNGKSAQLFGDNAAGKTTLFDAFVWCLFGKDSSNKKDFAVKTLNDDGSEIHNLEHSVELLLSVDGLELQLKRTYKEVYKKTRGSVTKTFSGHTTDFEINHVPSNEKDYKAAVANIVDEEIFKLVTSPTYFNTSVKWQDRRKILIDICGDVTNEAVVASNKKLAALNELLTNYSVEDAKAIVAAKRKKINEQLESIPVRIDELYNMIAGVEVDEAEVKANVERINQQIDGLKTQKINVQNGGALAEKRVALTTAEGDVQAYEREFNTKANEEVYKLQARVQEAQGNVQIAKGNLAQLEFVKEQWKQTYDFLQRDKQRYIQAMDELRVEFAKVKSKEFNHVDTCNCPTCEQPIPSEKVEAVRNEALAQFQLKQSEQKARINTQGITYKEKVEEINDKITAHTEQQNKIMEDIEKAQLEVEKFEKELEKQQKKLEEAKVATPCIEDDANYQELVSKVNEINAIIKDLELNIQDTLNDLNVEIVALETERKQYDEQLGKLASVATNRARIGELEGEQQRLMEEFELLEYQVNLLDEFTKSKVELLSERINSKFKYARFKMFDVQVNGGISETCETLYEGVPYGDGLNNAAKINVGLDIINTLSEHYGIFAPIFIDNAEAVTKLIDTNAQTIALYVSEQDKKLRVETKVLEEAI